MKAKVIMLETTTEETNIGLFRGELYIKSNSFDVEESDVRKQHIYLTNPNAEIKEGDWYYNEISKDIVKADFNIDYEQNHCSKIICASNKYLLTCDGVKKQGESCTKNNNCIYPKCQVLQLSSQSIKLLFNYYNKNGKMPKNVDVEVIEDCGYKEGDCIEPLIKTAKKKFLPCKINCPHWGYIKTSEDYWGDNYRKGTVDITIPYEIQSILNQTKEFI